MKKKILFVIFSLLICAKFFAGEYVYWEDHKTSKSGKTDIHVKICYAKGYGDSAKANKRIQDYFDLVNFYIKGHGEENPYTHNITFVNLRNGEIYKISFFYRQDGAGVIFVHRGNESMRNEDPMELIYQSVGSYWFTYNDYYELYQTQCNKYLNML